MKNNKSTFFYGIVIVIMGTLGIWASIPGQTMGVSTFTDPVKDALGLTRNQFSWAYTIGTILSSFLLGYAGKWFDKYGARRVAFGAAMGLSVALFLSSKSAVISSSLQGSEATWIVPFAVILFCFFLLRFTGQGILTMASRNMIMLWFDQYRGRVNAISAVAVSLGFSISPLWINMLIEHGGWQQAWSNMSILLFVMAILIAIFYRDSPESMGLKPDGNWLKKSNADGANKLTVDFTKKEALKTRAFWVYSLMLSFNGYFITGLTFHIVSIFKSAGLTKVEALSIFVPISILSVVTSIIFNALSDVIKLKKLLFLMIIAGIVTSVGVGILNTSLGYYMLVLGAGLMGGVFAVLTAVTWPRFYGRKHLGAISGVYMQMIVFSSALGPLLFSYSFKLFNTYSVIALLGLVALGVLLFAARKADNPQ
ncbi:MFS transporter [Saccharicrinis aurantiacus]|uniref:MFS transporter n=1 Tax=Saccharicrinis aurantiacus TaxID=1849719 RepID=UPI00094F7526|nr:MFS transporter [Saccharicrinis aurantiacus]